MKITLFLFLIIITTSSCKSLISVVENTNTERKFETTQGYLDFINKKINVPNDKVIILKDEMKGFFMSEIVSKKLSTYYGIVNKTYFVSADQLEMKSCSGQIETLYKKFEDNDSEISITKKSDISFLKNLNLDNTKNTLLFIYSYKLGALSKSKIADVIKDLSKKDNYDYRLISIDNYDIEHK